MDPEVVETAEAESAFDALFREHYAQVLAFAIRRCRSRQTAEEVASEVFLIAWRKWNQLPSQALPWLLASARKVLANERRGEARRVPAEWDPQVDLAERMNPANGVEEKVVERHLISQAFAQLSDRDRETLALVFWDGLSNRDAASVIGCSYSTFTLRLHRARRRFAKQLDRPFRN